MPPGAGSQTVPDLLQRRHDSVRAATEQLRQGRMASLRERELAGIVGEPRERTSRKQAEYLDDLHDLAKEVAKVLADAGVGWRELAYQLDIPERLPDHIHPRPGEKVLQLVLCGAVRTARSKVHGVDSATRTDLTTQEHHPRRAGTSTTA